MRYGPRPKFYAEPWTNDLDQLIIPGDDVIIFTCRSGGLVKTKGKFLGFNMDKEDYITSVRVQVTKVRRLYFNNKTGEQIKNRYTSGLKWQDVDSRKEEYLGARGITSMNVYKF
jgi:hypothetical protein